MTEVLTWLEQAEKNLKAQAQISNDVDEVKDQFHEHEVRYGDRIMIGFRIILRITSRIAVLIKVRIMSKTFLLKFQMILISYDQLSLFSTSTVSLRTVAVSFVSKPINSAPLLPK